MLQSKMAALLVRQRQQAQVAIEQQLQPYCFPITLPTQLAMAIRTHDVRSLKLFANDLLLTAVDLQLYPQAVQGNLFLPFKRVSPEFAVRHLRLSVTRVVLRAEPRGCPPVILSTCADQGVAQEFLVEEWDGTINAIIVADDTCHLAVPRPEAVLPMLPPA